jgi:hypothetical protein
MLGHPIRWGPRHRSFILPDYYLSNLYVVPRWCDLSLATTRTYMYMWDNPP